MLAGTRIFAVLTGSKVFVREAGIHRFDLAAPEKGWDHILPATLNAPVILSSDGCPAAISDGHVRTVDMSD